MNADPLDVLHKAMRLQEAIAAREQMKGKRANLGKMAEAMRTAATLAGRIADIEDRRAAREPRKPVEANGDIPSMAELLAARPAAPAAKPLAPRPAASEPAVSPQQQPRFPLN